MTGGASAPLAVLALIVDDAIQKRIFAVFAIVFVAVAVFLVWLRDWGDAHEGGPALLDVVGEVPRVMPHLHLPSFRADWMRQRRRSGICGLGTLRLCD